MIRQAAKNTASFILLGVQKNLEKKALGNFVLAYDLRNTSTISNQLITDLAAIKSHFHMDAKGWGSHRKALVLP